MISLFTNVTWDSACLRRHVSYPSMLAWVESAVRIAGELPDAALVICVHPADEKSGSRDDPREALTRSLGALPPNVRIVESTEAVDSYAIVAISTPSCRTRPPWVWRRRCAASGRRRRRGALPRARVHVGHPGRRRMRAAMADPRLAMTDEQVALARRYAFGFFFRWMVPFRPMEVGAGGIGSVTTDAADLEPGRDAYLDFACDRILDGGPFILPDELAAAG